VCPVPLVPATLYDSRQTILIKKGEMANTFGLQFFKDKGAIMITVCWKQCHYRQFVSLFYSEDSISLSRSLASCSSIKTGLISFFIALPLF